MTQVEWHCERCAAHGCIEFTTDDQGGGAFLLFTVVKDQHGRASPECEAESRELLVRLPLTCREQFPGRRRP